MAKELEAFVQIMDASTLQPDFVLVALGGDGTEWLVTSVAQRVVDRMMVVDMQQMGSTRTVTSRITPDDIVGRMVRKEWFSAQAP